MDDGFPFDCESVGGLDGKRHGLKAVLWNTCIRVGEGWSERLRGGGLCENRWMEGLEDCLGG